MKLSERLREREHAIDPKKYGFIAMVDNREIAEIEELERKVMHLETELARYKSALDFTCEVMVLDSDNYYEENESVHMTPAYALETDGKISKLVIEQNAARQKSNQI